MKVAVIGGGASGLVAAIYAAKSGNEVTLIEKNSDCGKKILITGNGRCNYFNTEINTKHYNSTDNRILERIITEKNQKEILTFFENIGIVPKIKNTYYYPMSNKAKSIKEALKKELELENVYTKINSEVKKIIKKENKFIITFEDNIESLKFDKVILALGSKAYPLTGSTGTGYNIAASFSHSIIKPLPALVPLICEGSYFKKWAGARCEAKVMLLEENNLIKEENGEVQFTDYGISGICVFNLSSLIARGLDNNKKEEVVINFVPWLEAQSIEEIINYLEQRENKVTGRNLKEFLSGFLEEKLVKTILEVSNINSDKYYSELTKKEKYKLARNLYSFKLKVIDTKSFDNAQICSGGVSLKEINPLTMESKIIKDLYIVGEMLDVDGDCGGYNLAFAFISGMLAGKGTGV